MHPDRLFPPDPKVRTIARRLYASVSDLPIISPHGHTDPKWFATDENFSDPAALFVTPDHYVFRMLYSQGVPLERLGIRRRDGKPVEVESVEALVAMALDVGADLIVLPLLTPTPGPMA